MRAQLYSKIIRFLCVGGLGFCVDAGVLGALLYFGISPIGARIVSIGCAIMTTYLLNRHFSFKPAPTKNPDEALRYVLVSLYSACLNYGVYVLCLGLMPPHVAMCFGVGAGMALNFIGYNFWVFSAKLVES